MLGESHETCGQDFGPGGSRGLHLFGNSRFIQLAEIRADAGVQDSKLQLG